ncbi:MAG: serine/threonine protein phosphatase [Thermotogaceae bacterium]|nr:serine/threonine protein phosphatase [Thermotogaceae bacterium]
MTYVVGDIHGCLSALEALVDKLPLTTSDEIVFLGDYVDRGPDSKGVIDKLINLAENHRCIFLRGNHELMMLNCLQRSEDCDLWSWNGAAATLRSYGGKAELISQSHMNFLVSTRAYYIVDEYFCVHAGVKPGVNLEDQELFDMVWIRDEFIYSENPLPGYTVVFGHTPFESVHRSPGKIGIDTGCVYGGMLTALRLEDGKLFHVSCRQLIKMNGLPNSRDSRC